MTEDDEMRDLERRMSAKLFGGVPYRTPVVEKRRRFPGKRKPPVGHIEVARRRVGPHPDDQQFDVFLVTIGLRINVRAGLFRDEIDAALRQYRMDKLEIKWLA